MSDTPNINDGGPAFPCKAYLHPSNTNPSDLPGMSLRDWFAGQALNGMDISRVLEDAMSRGEPPERFERALTRAAYKIADAMIAARNNPHPFTTISHENQD